MTIPGCGRLTPIHAAMVNLAGHAFNAPDESQEEKRRAIAHGRWELQRLTGDDFGFDLSKWHEYLMQEDKLGYCHSYGWSRVFPAVHQAIKDPERQQLVEQLEKPPEKLSSEGLAVAIVEALMQEGLLNHGLQTAVPIVRYEIKIRKILGEI
ncbi:MAG: hypothetical protein ACI93T_000305 [Porticoccaceae bacterium]|jgi:hypothetical protein